ncbi:MAG: periplasmic heavy metal sensor [Acidobacteria bacterium]|nr:periplasmic heavy metal sensor [Acidobacteriota bacterium]MBI3280813.1 periplasmic heavy metal sensor [Acidobacteriota bacterium]
MKYAFLFVCLAVAAMAQPPRLFFPFWDGPLARDLNLTEQQQQQIRETVREHRDRLIDLRAALEKAEGELEDAFNEERLDQGRANQAIERLAAARAELTRAFSQMSLKLRAALTSGQWRELQKRRPHGPPGPGGPRMRPGPEGDRGQPGPGGGPPPRREF